MLSLILLPWALLFSFFHPPREILFFVILALDFRL